MLYDFVIAITRKIVQGVGLSVFLVTLSSATPAATSTAAQQYELTERCSKNAADWFARQWGSGVNQTERESIFTSYRNHYNAKQNRCFVLLTLVTHSKVDPNERLGRHFELIDILENNQLGMFTASEGRAPTVCYVLDVNCEGESVWQGMVRPFMTE